MVNETINATIAQQGWTASIFFPMLGERILLLLSAPLRIPSMIYIIIPMSITLLLMEFYFGRYKREELGWNTAVGNALVLIFVAVDLLKTTFNNLAPMSLLLQMYNNLFGGGEAASTVIIIIIFVLGMLLLLTDFLHALPKRLAFAISSSLPINLIAYLGIVMVYSHNAGATPIPLDIYTFLAALVLFIGLIVLFGVIHIVEPEYKEKTDLKLSAGGATQVKAEDQAKEEFSEASMEQDKTEESQ